MIQVKFRVRVPQEPNPGREFIEVVYTTYG
jgi:hypothetical protein